MTGGAPQARRGHALRILGGPRPLAPLSVYIGFLRREPPATHLASGRKEFNLPIPPPRARKPPATHLANGRKEFHLLLPPPRGAQALTEKIWILAGLGVSGGASGK